MPKFIYQEVKPSLDKWEAIKCIDCRVFLFSKKEASKHHKGHDVRYCDKAGNILDDR